MPSSSIVYLLFVIRSAQCFEVPPWTLAAAAQIFPEWLWSPPAPSPPTRLLLSTDDELMTIIDRAARPPVDGRELFEAVEPPLVSVMVPTCNPG